MYVCGLTVYDYCHIGHARVMVAFDVIARWLLASGYQLEYVRNITDVDDKIIQRAKENNESVRSLTNRFIRIMHEDERALNVMKPDHEPRATEYIQPMQQMVSRLIDNGLAYVSDNGDVFYAVRKFNDYGKLSGKSLDDLRAGARVEIEAGKRDALDFVLWKRHKEEEPREVSWPSPWGDGRPGWHLECSAMSTDLLGTHFDIHGGGHDLQFPHHENEIAQSEGCYRDPFVNYWLHNGFVRIDKEKMSKSLGNFFTIREVLSRYDAEVLRFFLLRSHYRSPLNYSDSALAEARQALDRLYTALLGHPVHEQSTQVDWQNSFALRFKEAMDDDFNTPAAIAVLFALTNEIHKSDAPEQVATLAELLRNLGGVLGLLQNNPLQYRQSLDQDGCISADQINQLIAQRAAAKARRDFAAADRIRDELKNNGISLEDGPSGTTWRQR